MSACDLNLGGQWANNQNTQVVLQKNGYKRIKKNKNLQLTPDPDISDISWNGLKQITRVRKTNKIPQLKLFSTEE